MSVVKPGQIWKAAAPDGGPDDRVEVAGVTDDGLSLQPVAGDVFQPVVSASESDLRRLFVLETDAEPVEPNPIEFWTAT